VAVLLPAALNGGWRCEWIRRKRGRKEGKRKEVEKENKEKGKKKKYRKGNLDILQPQSNM
jgi:hypothetical protein